MSWQRESNERALQLPATHLPHTEISVPDRHNGGSEMRKISGQCSWAPFGIQGLSVGERRAVRIEVRVTGSVSSPEKAGVGGSIPSLATMTNSVTSKRVGAFSQPSTASQNNPRESQ